MLAGNAIFRFTLRELALVTAIVGLALGWWLDHRRLQGHLDHTGNSLDLTIEGAGYFQLSDPKTSSLLYTRRGCFRIDGNGMLVTEIQGVERSVNPAIAFPNRSTGIAVTPDGSVLVQVNEVPSLRRVGQLQLSVFEDPSKLRRVAEGVYAEAAESGPPQQTTPGSQGAGKVLQGVLDRREAQKSSLTPTGLHGDGVCEPWPLKISFRPTRR
jgi:flagellar basal body rod protein FlgG